MSQDGQKRFVEVLVDSRRVPEALEEAQVDNMRNWNDNSSGKSEHQDDMVVVIDHDSRNADDDDEHDHDEENGDDDALRNRGVCCLNVSGCGIHKDPSSSSKKNKQSKKLPAC